MFAAPSAVNPLQKPVSVYALDYSPQLSTAFTCYSTTLLGTNYCVLAYFGSSGNQFAIVATASNTTVITTPSATANLDGHPTAYTNTMQPGQTYQIGSDGYLYDVTGTVIKSDKPIAVFAGANDALAGNQWHDKTSPT